MTEKRDEAVEAALRAWYGCTNWRSMFLPGEIARQAAVVEAMRRALKAAGLVRFNPPDDLIGGEDGRA